MTHSHVTHLGGLEPGVEGSDSKKSRLPGAARGFLIFGDELGKAIGDDDPAAVSDIASMETS